MPIALVPSPKASDEVRDSIVKVLRETLELAEAGELDCIILIVQHADGDWTNKASETMKFSEAIGRLEITKQEWILNYLNEE